MRKTRLVILPTKCLHQMGFLLLFLSCPVIGDWGRIRPESENLHKAIQMDREGTCGLQRDPPGELLNFPNEIRSDQCRPSEDFDLNSIAKKPIFRNVRSEERRVDSQSTHQRNSRVSERRHATDRKSVQKAESRLLDEKKGTRRESQRRVDERRTVKKEPERRTVDERREIRRTSQTNLRRDVREHSQPRNRVTGYSPSSLRQSENEQAFKRQRLAVARNIRNDNKIETRNEREESQQTRRIFEKRVEKETAGRSLKERTNDRRENEMRIRNAQATKERQNRRVVRSTEREKKDVRRDDQRSVRERSLRRRETTTVRQTRERSQERQIERLSLARREQSKEIRKSENERNIERSESRLSQIRKSRSFENLNDAFERRQHKDTKRFDIRRNVENGRFVNPLTKTNQRELRERRVELLNDKAERIMEMKTVRINSSAKNQNLPEDLSLDKKIGKEENISEEITKWMNLKRFENLKVGDWTTNCVVGAVVYFLSTKQIKAV